MYIPIVPYTNAINKTIVYGDIVLPIHKEGNNIIISSITNIDESSLEKCLKTIFESNKDALFHVVQYSKNDKKVYFYTDKEINTKIWEDSKVSIHKKTESVSILNEIKNIFTQEINTDEECISLYDVAILMKTMNSKYEEIKTHYQYILEDKLYPSKIIIYGFDYDSNELKIGVSFLGEFYKICFTKENDDLFITKSKYYDVQKVLLNLGNDLSKLYDKFIEFKNFKQEYSYGIKTVNSMFYSNISTHGVDILKDSIYSKIFTNDFRISSNSYSSKYRYNCNSCNVLNTIKGNEDELFKRIFVKIENCPKWCQNTLNKIRKQQLEKDKQKRKTFKNRFKQFIDRHF